MAPAFALRSHRWLPHFRGRGSDGGGVVYRGLGEEVHSGRRSNPSPSGGDRDEGTIALTFSHCSKHAPHLVGVHLARARSLLGVVFCSRKVRLVCRDVHQVGVCKPAACPSELRPADHSQPTLVSTMHLLLRGREQLSKLVLTAGGDDGVFRNSCDAIMRVGVVPLCLRNRLDQMRRSV